MAQVDERARPWQDCVFCMLGPDCLRRHLARPALDRFREVGLEAVSWHVTHVSPVLIDAMSEAQGAGPGQVYRYRALDALFELGPALLLVLRDRRARSADEIYDVAKRLKGDAHPERAKPGSLRHDLHAVNVVLSLFHLSDSPEASAREAAILLGGASWPAQRGGLDEVVELLEDSQPRETRLFPEVLTAVRGRVALALWPLLSAAGQRLATQLAAKGQLAEPDAGERLCAELTGASQAEAVTWQAQAAAGAVQGVVGLAGVLRARFDGTEPAPAMPEVQRLLRAYRMGLDPWEYTVLATSAYFPPRR